MDDNLRVLIVDDSVTYRKLASLAITGLPGIEVVGTAANGRIALERLDSLRVDLLLLDLEMPELNGLQTLRRLQELRSPVGAIMLSAFTRDGAQATVEALDLGAFDFALKPIGGGFDENLGKLRNELRQRLEAFRRRHGIRKILGQPPAVTLSRLPPPAARPVAPPPPVVRTTCRPEVVVLGISTGGPPALTQMLPKLPATLSAPLLIVQHMPAFFTRSLAEDLNRRCQLRVAEAADGQQVTAGTILIAPGGKQMKVRRENGLSVVRITDDPPENSCRPSVDYLFRSAAETYGGNVLGVIMTGMGNDGAAGCRLLKQRGAAIVAQDQASCVVFGMPREPIEEGLADVVAPLDSIATEITRLAGRR